MKTPNHLPHVIDAPFQHVAGSLGLPADQLRLVFCFAAAIPLGIVHKNLPSTQIKHVYAAVLGALTAYFVTGFSSFHLFVSSAVVYYVTKRYPHRPGRIAIGAMLYMSLSHIYRMYADYLGWSLDYTMLLMVWVVKVSTYAYNVGDGYLLRTNTTQPLHDRDSIHQFRASHAILKQPSMLEFYSYVLYYGNVLVGPCIEYTDYIGVSDLSIVQKDGYSRIPSTIVPALKCVAKALLCYIGVYARSQMPVMGYINTPEFYANPALSYAYKCFYIFLSVSFVRFTYYFAWSCSEAGCVAGGYGYNGTKTDKQTGRKWIDWSRITNVDIIAVETATNFSIVTNKWNMGVNNWLKNYVYMRVNPSRRVTRIIPTKSAANIVTKLTSAFWHGVYSAYYLFFLSAWLVNEADTVMQTVIARYFVTVTADKVKLYKSPVHRIVWVAVSWFFTLASLNYMACAFVLLRGTWALAAWRSIGYTMHIVCIAIVILGKLITIVHPLKRSVKKVEYPSNKPAEVIDTSVKAVNGNGTNGGHHIAPENGHTVTEKTTRSGIKYA